MEVVSLKESHMPFMRSSTWSLHTLRTSLGSFFKGFTWTFYLGELHIHLGEDLGGSKP
jgi:hypothetical protein